MKKYLTILILVLSISSCAQEKKCLEFRTGEFRYVDDNMPEKIIRNDTLQIEINTKDNIEVHSLIEWTSDCEYVMTYKKILNYPDDVSDVIGKKIFVTILETKGNWYKVHAKGVFSDGEIEFVKID